MEPQLFDQFVEDSWSAESCGLQPMDTTSDLWFDSLWPNQYDPLPYDFEDLQGLHDLESNFNPSNSSSPPNLKLHSPISASSFLGVQDLFSQKSLINPWDIPTAFNNIVTPAAPCNSPSTESSTPIAIPNLAASPGSSESSSPQDIECEIQTKRPTKQTRKHQSKNSRTKSPASKHQTAHNLIEKKYRNNLNSKIRNLRDSIPTLRSQMKENEEGEDEMDSDSGESRKVQKCNKGIILDKAIEYIAELEKRVERMSVENIRLQLKIKGNIPSYLIPK